MIRKILRMTAIFCVLALVLSPIYFKNVRHYIKQVQIIDGEFENKSIVNTGSYKCLSNGKIPLVSNSFKIIHFTSLKCKSCIKDIETWQTLPSRLQKILNVKEPIEILNLVQENDFNDTNQQEFFKNLTKAIDHQSIQDVSEANISVCTLAIPEAVFKQTNVDVLPSLFVLKHGNIIYSLTGSLTAADITNLLSIIQKEIK